MQVSMVVLDGRHAGRQFELPATQFVIGRDPRCHLRPASSEVSRFHCALATYAGLVHVRDLKSRNGTFVNDRRVSGAVRLHRGDILRVGPLRFEILVQSTPRPAQATSSDSSLGWLVRSPDESERAVLDPSVRTVIGIPASARTAKVGVARPRRVDQAHKNAGAVAGDFLREYLLRRTARQN
jgi:pSer/pThr/pTyr-binding forkhead associated (FHA) protein